jgi:hypothetical protein
VSSFHDDRRAREDNRNERSIRERAEAAHTEFKIAHLDPDRPHQDGALGAAGVAVVQRSRALPANVHADDPYTVLSRIFGSADRFRGRSGFVGRVTYDEAINLAALWTVLAAAIDRAEHADPNSGGDA